MAISIDIGVDELRTMIDAAVTQALLRHEQRRSQLENEIYTEADAAKVLRLNKRQLAGERKKGRIGASRIVGRQIRYLKVDLVNYMHRNRINAAERPPVDEESPIETIGD